jgi:hypothetical protein
MDDFLAKPLGMQRLVDVLGAIPSGAARVPVPAPSVRS